MTEGQAEQIERIVDGLAAALFAGALGYALFTLRRGACAEPQTGLLSAVAAGLAFLFCFRLLTPIAPEPRRFEMRQIDLRPIEQTDELLLTEPVELLLTEQVELVLTDVDRLQPQETHGRDELVLDDILAELGPDSRVVRLFDPAAMPTPGQLNDRIARHIREGASPSSAPPDASQALYDALSELRRSLR
jgi:hypothetical protein